MGFVALMFLLQLTICSTVFCQEDTVQATAVKGLRFCTEWQCCPAFLRCCWKEYTYKCCRGPSSRVWIYPVLPCN